MTRAAGELLERGAFDRDDPHGDTLGGMRARLLWLGAGFAGITVVQACVGDEPPSGSAPGTSSAPDAEVPLGSSSSSSSSSSSGSGEEDASVPTYGIFLTSKLYATDFGKDIPTSQMFAFVDVECKTAAETAGLARPEAYKPLISVTDDYQNASADLNRLLSYRSGAAERARWCNITDAADCSITGPIFENGADFERGPRHSLYTDEFGQAKNISGRFLSGFHVDPEFITGRVRNCIGWKLREASGSVDAGSGLQYLDGVGHMLRRDVDGGGRPYA